ncbi:hypothetical protein RRSWK_03144 [Rhodopirellula sp. SWK7]|nr:hypothetical protein RRSWK_03144 [Rhodopirellula sp. SWK7]
MRNFAVHANNPTTVANRLPRFRPISISKMFLKYRCVQTVNGVCDDASDKNAK